MDAGIELKTVLSFLKKLESNNSKEWMDLNKKEYEKSKEYFLKIVDFIIKSTSKFDATVAHLEPKKT
jgi:transcription termination factor NusB